MRVEGLLQSSLAAASSVVRGAETLVGRLGSGASIIEYQGAGNVDKELARQVRTLSSMVSKSGRVTPAVPREATRLTLEVFLLGFVKDSADEVQTDERLIT